MKTFLQIIIAICMIAFIAPPIMEPDMTDMRLLITFWPLYLSGLVIVMGCIYWLHALDKPKGSTTVRSRRKKHGRSSRNI